jgi:hypothetical protein
MRTENSVVGIVKRYFDNALIIDDQISFEFHNETYETVPDSELENLPDVMEYLEDTVAVTSEESIEVEEKTSQLFQDLTREGVIVLPYKYQIGNDDSQINMLSAPLINAKLLVLDWNLENANSGSVSVPGTASMQILEKYITNRTGLKCVVIYTQEDKVKVIEKVSEKFEIIDEGSLPYFQDTSKEDENSLFGFIIDKKFSYENIMESIGDILLKDKCIPLHIMDSSYRIEKSLSNVMNKFNAPFENVMFTQMLSSSIESEEIPSFLDGTLLSELLTEHSKISPVNFIFQSKKTKILHTLEGKKIEESEIVSFLEIVNMTKAKRTVLNTLCKEKCNNKVIEILKDDTINSFDLFKESLRNELHFSPEQVSEVVLFLMLIEDYRNKDDFRDSFIKQTYYLTKLLKYTNKSNDEKIETGSIWIDKNEPNRYLLCITPFCDTYRPEKVANTYKFIVGEVTDPKPNLLKNDSTNFAFIGIPLEEEKKLVFVKWNFYEVTSLKSEKFDENMEKICTLKKEYIQKIINSYIGYQSRAGVEELFFKDTYRENFVGFLM